MPVPLAFDMWVHFGDGEFKLTDPVDSTGITGIECRRTHDGSCGAMQFEQLESEKNRVVFKNAWEDILPSCRTLRHMHAAAPSARDGITSRSCTCWFPAGRHGTGRR